MDAPGCGAQAEGVEKPPAFDSSPPCYTLLGVRPDGVASVVDLVAVEDALMARSRARALLREHLSCNLVEVWRDGDLVERLSR
jgi:hypothetical protein